MLCMSKEILQKPTGKSSRGFSSKSAQQEQGPSISPPYSFLFVVDELPINDSSEIPPRLDENGRWCPPIYRDGFSPPHPGHLYRWRNGVVSAIGQPNIQLTPYETTTVFWCNPFNQFFTAIEDVSTFDMATAQSPCDRWYPLAFEHEGNLSLVQFVADQEYLASTGAGAEPGWIHRLGLDSYRCPYEPYPGAPRARGLGGDLSILIALISFSCSFNNLDRALLEERAWHDYRWRGHSHHHGR